MHKGFLVTAILLGALSVALGAFGAHALKGILAYDALHAYETAVRYQFFHVFALALTAILYKSYPVRQLKTAGALFIAGMILFSGSLYLLTCIRAIGINGFQWLGAITPVGGIVLILAWCFLAVGVRKG